MSPRLRIVLALFAVALVLALLAPALHAQTATTRAPFPTLPNATSGPRLVFSADTVRTGAVVSLWLADVPTDHASGGLLLRDTTGYGAVAKILKQSAKARAVPVVEVAPNGWPSAGPLSAANPWRVTARRQGVQDIRILITDWSSQVVHTYSRRLVVLPR